MDRNGKVVEEIFEEILESIVYSDKEEEEYVEEHSIDMEIGSETERTVSIVCDTMEETTERNEKVTWVQ